MTLWAGLYLSSSPEWVLGHPSSSSPLPRLRLWMITVGCGSLGTSSKCFSKTIVLIMMYTISSMATSTTSHSHSLLCGIESWVPTCHTDWRRGRVGVLNLDLVKITRMSSFFAWWAFFMCTTSIVLPSYEQHCRSDHVCIYVWCVLFYIFLSLLSILDRLNNGNCGETYQVVIFTLVLMATIDIPFTPFYTV